MRPGNSVFKDKPLYPIVNGPIVTNMHMVLYTDFIIFIFFVYIISIDIGYRMESLIYDCEVFVLSFNTKQME